MDNDGGMEVRQNTMLAASEGTAVRRPMLKMGVPLVGDIWSYLALQGRMFNLSETTQGTVLTAAVADATSNVLTIPSLRLTVPTGLTVFPYRFNIAWQARAGTITEGMIVASETDTYTSGGVAIVPRNWRTDNPRATAAANIATGSGTGIVEAALVRPRSLYKFVHTHAIAATDVNNIEKMWPALWPIVGPASLLIYLGSVTTAGTYLFSLDWAELPTINAV
jgi:hypothetical protein